MELQRVRRPEGPQDWDAQRDVITDLYITKGLELEDLMKTMEEKHYFKATKKQYKTYFTKPKWDLRKNIRPSEYNGMIQKRRKREEEGKSSAFRLRGALVDDSKIVRYEKKPRRGNEHEIVESGTPEDLSCFTPSPVVGSPKAPSPVPLHFRSPSPLRSSIVSSSEQIFLVPNPLHLFSEAPDFKVDRIFTTPLVVSPALGSWISRTVDDIIKAATCQKMERFESNLSHYPRLHSSITRLLSGFIERAHERTTFSRLRRSAFFALVVLQKLSDIGHLSRCVIRLKPASTDSLRKNHIFTSNDVPGGAKRFKISVRALGRQTVIILPDLTTDDLEQKHSSPLRRSESCESIRSMESFLSDPVVDWKELLYGYNREAASKERKF